jgi:hypothetical protein
MERVTVISGEVPLMVVAPHCDDNNTKEIAQFIASTLKCYCVTNNGWKRSDTVDAIGGYANCNDVSHCLEDVVKEEFLEPILGYANRMVKNYGHGYVFYIHGMGQQSPDVIVGYGEGNPPSYSCGLYYKEVFLKACRENSVYATEAGAGSKYAGRSKNNMNQLFRNWFYNDKIQSMQLEIAYNLRTTQMIRNVGMALGMAFDDLLDHKINSSYINEFTGI